MKKQPTYRDIQEARPAELQRIYKLNQAGLENAVRKHAYGANQAELRKEYDKFYRKNRRDA
jgi:hypothetical protein